MLLMCAGGFFALKAYKQSRPSPVWVPLLINPELPVEKRDEIVSKLKTELDDKELLMQVSKDVGLPAKWDLAGDEEGAAEISSRLFVREGDGETPQGRMPAIHVGINGVRKENKVTSEIAVRLMKDVFEILGIPQPENNGR